MWIDTIDHVQITSPPDVAEEMHLFYNMVLGLPELAKPKSLQTNGGAWCLLGNTQLHVSLEKDARNYVSRWHVCFRVPSLTTFQQYLEAHDVGIILNRQPIEGYDHFYLRDPSGNRTEIAAPK